GGFLGLTSVGLDDGDARDLFAHVRVHARCFGADRAERLAGTPANERDEQANEGNENERAEGELRVQGNHEHNGAKQADEVPECAQSPRRKELEDGVAGVRNASDEAADRLTIEEAEREPPEKG